MKRYIYFALFATLFCQTSIAFADFFIPASELEPHYEKLPPIPNSATYKAKQSVNPDNNIKRYIPVDGRFIPVVEKTQAEENLTQQEPLVTEPVTETKETAETTKPVKTAEKPEEPKDLPIKKEDFHSPNRIKNLYAPEAPKTNPIDLSLPSYKNRYAQYLETLKELQQNGNLPPNPELDATLSKLNSNEYVVVYKERLL